MTDPTETARRVLDLSARAFDTRSLAYQQANEAFTAAPELARALLESQAALAAANARADAAEADVGTFVGECACAACGARSSTGTSFLPISSHMGDEDIACGSCGSTDTDEIGPVLSRLTSDVDTLRSEQDALRADLARVTAERTTLVNDLIDYENVRQHLAATEECQKRHDTLDRVENERDALRADLARVTAERDSWQWINGLTEGVRDQWIEKAIRDEKRAEKAESDLATARESVRELVAELRDTAESVAGSATAVDWVGKHDLDGAANWEKRAVEMLHRFDALLAKHAAPAPTPAADEEAAFVGIGAVLQIAPPPAAVPGLAEPLAPPGTDRWEAGIDHEPASVALYKSIAAIDEEMFDDSFCFKAGGDGDNGETLMYLLDEHFARAHNAARLAKKGGE